jgi:hypothetical protein
LPHPTRTVFLAIVVRSRVGTRELSRRDWEEGSNDGHGERCVNGDGWERESWMTGCRRQAEGTEFASVGGFRPFYRKRVEFVGDTVDGTTGMGRWAG